MAAGAAAAAGWRPQRHDPGSSAGAGRTAWHAIPGPVRPGEPTGRTPAAPWRTAASAGRPSFRTASPRCQPDRPILPRGRRDRRCSPGSGSSPGSVPIPVPGQELKDTARETSPSAQVPRTRATEAHHAAKPKVGVARRTRKARLRLSRLDPWSVMKTSFLFSIAAGIMLVAAVYSIWTVLSTSQLFDSINDIVRSVVSTPGDTTPFRIQEYINTQKVMGVTALIACVDVVIFTALATLGSFLYNLAATMLGGLEITLAED